MNSQKTPNDAHPELAPLRAMISGLPAAALEEVARALHARLNAPPSAAQRRIRELGYLARLLDERPQPPERLPYFPRVLYDERRPIEKPDAPPSARLQERFGSWPRACHAAWGLKPDGRSISSADPWPRPARGARIGAVEAIASVCRMAAAIGRAPSSHEYHHWVIASRARARREGTTACPFVPISSVYRLIAPDRCGGNGWRLVIARTLDREPEWACPEARLPLISNMCSLQLVS